MKSLVFLINCRTLLDISHVGGAYMIETVTPIIIITELRSIYLYDHTSYFIFVNYTVNRIVKQIPVNFTMNYMDNIGNETIDKELQSYTT
jgi:hypothetical protein